jgi:hypothetical protein
MAELLAPGGRVDVEVVSGSAMVTTATYLNYYGAVGRLGYPTAIASNPIREADESSPWWQGRMVCRPWISADAVVDPSAVSVELHDEVESYLREHDDVGVQSFAFESAVYVDLGSGAVTSLPIGNLMPVIKNWTWTSPEEQAVEGASFLPIQVASTEVVKLPAAEPGWNEAEDELPRWVELDLGECSSGALMSRRRPSADGE